MAKPRNTKTTWLALIGLSLLFVTGSLVAGYVWRQPETTAAIRGEEIARRLGCFDCHGEEGRGGVADPEAKGGCIPGWDGPTVATYAKDEPEIREWILHGVPARLERATPTARRKPFIPMPAYQKHLSNRELADLMAYFRAVSGWDPDMPEAAYEGRKIALRLGCFGCHGPSGMGGRRNPGSFKGFIPAWDGDEFAELVQDDEELREWLLDGVSRRLWQNPAARHFLEQQVIKMPAYRPRLSDDETSKVVAYIRWLRKQ